MMRKPWNTYLSYARNLVPSLRDLTLFAVLRLFCLRVLCVSVVKFFLLRGEFVCQVLFRGG